MQARRPSHAAGHSWRKWEDPLMYGRLPRQRVVPWLILFAVVCLSADLLTFLYMLSAYGLEAERNPVVHLVGLEAAVAFKFLMMVYVATVTCFVARYRRAVTITAVVFGVVGALSNLAVLYG